MTRYEEIQKAILDEIARPDFSAALPPLSDRGWLNILSTSQRAVMENERLEFLGDALMYATIARQLYQQIPYGTPGLYTDVRAALHSNVTFSRLAEKLDILAVSGRVLESLTAKTFGAGTSAPFKTTRQVKATADLFETVIGAYHLEKGFEYVSNWVGDIYRPLFVVAKRAYFNHKYSKAHTSRARSPQLPKYAKVYSPMKPAVIICRRERTLLGSSRKVFLTSNGKAVDRPSHRSMSSSNLPVSPSQLSPVITPRRASPHGPSTAAESKSHAKAGPITIDLTALDDSDDEMEDVVFVSAPKAPPAIVPPPPDSYEDGEIPDDEDATDELLTEKMLLDKPASSP